MEKTIEVIENYMRKNGFIYGPEPEIYDPVAGLYTYGPLGCLLKRNIENFIRKEFMKQGFFEVESPIIAPREVWIGSGHLKDFVDLVVECNKCNASFRGDKLIEEKLGKIVSGEEILEEIEKNEIRCPNCGGKFKKELKMYNLMVRSDLGNRECYARPETATMTYLSYKRYYEFFRRKYPFRIFQVGKAFRNEISPRQNVIRGREFTQMEGQIFLVPERNYGELFKLDLKEKVRFIFSDGNEIFMDIEEAEKSNRFHKNEYLQCLFLAYEIFRKIGFPQERIRLRQHKEEERAHYALDAWDLEIKTYSLGWIECCGIHDRGNYDLREHSKVAKEDLKVSINGEEFYANILEIAFGIDRPLFCLIDIFLDEETVRGEKRRVLRIDEKFSPIKVAVFPLVNKDGLEEIANEIYLNLLNEGIEVFYDDSGSIGRRYRRMDERGTPFALTVDYQTKKDNTVTIRFRDSMKQERIKIGEIADFIKKRCYYG